MPVLWMLLIASVMSTAAPLLMALVQTDQIYWQNAFFAQVSDQALYNQLLSHYLHVSVNLSIQFGPK